MTAASLVKDLVASSWACSMLHQEPPIARAELQHQISERSFPRLQRCCSSGEIWPTFKSCNQQSNPFPGFTPTLSDARKTTATAIASDPKSLPRCWPGKPECSYNPSRFLFREAVALKEWIRRSSKHSKEETSRFTSQGLRLKVPLWAWHAVFKA